MKPMLCMICTVFIFGCAGLPPIENQSANEIASRSTVTRDDFKKVSCVDGEKYGVDVFNKSAFTGSDYYDAWLHAERQDGKETSFALIVKTTRGYSLGWAFWEDAYDKDGAKLNVEKIASEVGDGGFTYELIGVRVERSYLESHKSSGIVIRIDGKRAQRIINIAPNYIDGFLKKTGDAGI